MDNLKDRIALVTGSSRGIGRAIAVALAAAGADTVLNFLGRSADAQAVELEIRGLGRRCISIQADVSRASEVERLVRGAADGLGPIDILVNNAGIARPQPIEEIRERDWDELIAVNLKSCFLLTQAVLPGMRARRWGRIVNLSSVAAQVGGRCRTALRRLESRHAGPDALLFAALGPGGDHGERHRSGAH